MAAVPALASSTVVGAGEGGSARSIPTTIHGPVADVALALAWVPFALVGHWAGGGGRPLAAVVGATLLFSFSHQGPTIALVHGDPAQRALRRRTFLWSAPVFAVAIAVGVLWAPLLLALVAGGWNVVHTLQQRYGLVRTYGRKGGGGVGDGGGDHARIERALLFTALAAAIAWAGTDARVPGLVERAQLGAVNQTALETLVDARAYARVAVVGLVGAVAVLLALWIRGERRLGAAANPAKHRYMASTLVLLAVIAVSPAAGFVGYVGSHALEYFVVVHGALAKRYRGPAVARSPLAAVVRRRGGRALAWGLYAVVLVAFLVVVNQVVPYPWSSVAILTVGGCHVFWDGYIWKLRRPEVASSLGI